MLEHAIWLDFVKRRLEKAFFLQLIVVVIVEGTELLSLFVQELEVGSAFILDILGLVCLVVPIGFLLPLFVFLLFEVSGVVEVVLFLGFFAVYTIVSRGRWREMRLDVYSSTLQGVSGTTV
jgi:hypothetical protein